MGALYNPLDEIDKTAVTGILKGDGAAISAAVSGTDIKTVNGASLLGAGDVAIGGGALVYLSTVTVTDSATVDVTAGFSATYDNYILTGDGITGPNSSILLCRLKIGGLYLDTNNQFHTTTSSVGATTYNAMAGSGAAGIIINPMLQSTAPYSVSFSMRIFDANNSASQKTIRCDGFSQAAAALAICGATNTTVGALSGVRFYSSFGNISGTFKLYGIAKA